MVHQRTVASRRSSHLTLMLFRQEHTTCSQLIQIDDTVKLLTRIDYLVCLCMIEELQSLVLSINMKVMD